MCFLWLGSTEAFWRKAGVPWRSLSMPCTSSLVIDFKIFCKPSCKELLCGTFPLPICSPCFCSSRFLCPANGIWYGVHFNLQKYSGRSPWTLLQDWASPLWRPWHESPSPYPGRRRELPLPSFNLWNWDNIHTNCRVSTSNWNKIKMLYCKCETTITWKSLEAAAKQ